MTRFESLVSGLAAATGLPLQVDGQDAVSLESGGTIVTLQYRRGLDDLVLFAPVAGPGAELSAGTLRTALELACHGRGTRGNFLGLFDETLVLSAVLPLEGMDAGTLAARILAFTDAAEEVEAALEQAASPGDSPASAPPPPPGGLMV